MKCIVECVFYIYVLLTWIKKLKETNMDVFPSSINVINQYDNVVTKLTPMCVKVEHKLRTQTREDGIINVG